MNSTNIEQKRTAGLRQANNDNKKEPFPSKPKKANHQQEILLTTNYHRLNFN